VPLYEAGSEADDREAADAALKVLADAVTADDRVLVTWEPPARQRPD
jgi:hypothetical protein